MVFIFDILFYDYMIHDDTLSVWLSCDRFDNELRGIDVKDFIELCVFIRQLGSSSLSKFHLTSLNSLRIPFTCLFHLVSE